MSMITVDITSSRFTIGAAPRPPQNVREARESSVTVDLIGRGGGLDGAERSRAA